MKYFISLLSIILLGIGQVHAYGKYPIIPYPKVLQAMEGYFIFQSNMQLSIPSKDKEVHQIATDFINRLSKVSGLQLTIAQDSIHADIAFTQDKSLGKEAYLLNISPEKSL